MIYCQRHRKEKDHIQNPLKTLLRPYPSKVEHTSKQHRGRQREFLLLLLRRYPNPSLSLTEHLKCPLSRHEDPDIQTINLDFSIGQFYNLQIQNLDQGIKYIRVK